MVITANQIFSPTYLGPVKMDILNKKLYSIISIIWLLSKDKERLRVTELYRYQEFGINR